MGIRVTKTAFDPEAELAGLSAGRRDAGALASFVGYCRDATGDRAVDKLHIEHYPGFTERDIERLVKEVAGRFQLKDLLVIHRVGDIAPGEAIVLVAALSGHRAQAFDAVRLMMDYLKTDAPLWKKETGPDGARWIEPHSEDHARRARAGEKA
jgi:molybdopterin synthase catalytic subunit